VVGELPVPARSGYTFKGWFTASSGGAQIVPSTYVTANITYYAVWESVTAPPPETPTTPVTPSTPSTPTTPTTPTIPTTPETPTTPVSQFTVTFNANGGAVSPKSKTATDGTQVGSLPTPKRTGYDFKGWYTAKSGGVKVSANTVIGSDATYYAQWQVKSYKVTFNANKGKVSGKAKLVKRVKYGSKLGKLTTPKRAGYKFKGWYTKKSGGKNIKSSTKIPARNTIYYAQWKKK
jgi:uncharacterized repeat protein (TIGR02543 family)